MSDRQIALQSSGYYFSEQPFLSQQSIEAQQLAIMLGCNTPESREIILEASPRSGEASRFELVLEGCARVVDQQARPVSEETLRALPPGELAESALATRGWRLVLSPCFRWLHNNCPLFEQPFRRISSSWLEELERLQRLLKSGQGIAPAQLQQGLMAG